MHLSRRIMLTGAGIGLAALFAITVISLGSSDSDKVEATNLTPTIITPVATATPPKTPTGSGSLSGVYDIHIHIPGNPATSLYFCIAREDHYGDNTLKDTAVCYNDVPGGSDPSSPLPNSLVCAPGCVANVNPDINTLGPPPPPPYNSSAPQTMYGMYQPGPVEKTIRGCASALKGLGRLASEAWSGLKGLVPKIDVYINVKGTVNNNHQTGTVNIIGNQNNVNCPAGTPKTTGKATGVTAGPPGTMTDDRPAHIPWGDCSGSVVTMGGKTMTIASNTATTLTGTGGWSGGGAPAAGPYEIAPGCRFGVTLEADLYRVSDLAGVATGTLGPALLGRDVAHATDYDGDGCLDSDELDKTHSVKQCGDDPTNPLDSDHNYAGTYDITVLSTEADLCQGGNPRPTTPYPFGCMGVDDGTYLPGGYFNCIGTIAHTKVTPTPKYEPISAKAFCYVDNPLNSINSQAAGAGVCTGGTYQRCGNGTAGEAPPSFAPKATGPVETDLQCLDMWDNDGDTIPNDGCTSNWADNNATNATTLGTDTHTNLGLLKGWLDNNNNVLVLEGCFIVDAPSTFAPATYARLVVDQHSGVGTVDIWTGQANCTKPGGAPTNNDLPVILTQQESTDDTDRDGCTDARELGGAAANWGAAAGGGLRDPFWTFDFFDADGNKANGLADINFIAAPAHIFKTEGLNGYTWRGDRTAVQTGSANPAPPASVVALGPPDRALGLTDINLSARQFANSCA